ncbi:MAG: motif [Pseudomonadota bacterium]|jgi:uncharacterized protein YecA (UPF0149 family)
MSYPEVLTSLTTLLNTVSARFTEVFSPHQALGALVSGRSAPIELTAEELLELVLNQETDSAEALLMDTQLAAHWNEILHDVDALMTDEQWLHNGYSPVGTPPNSAVAQWCDGYLQAYWYCEDVWQEFYSVWEEIAADSANDDDFFNIAETHPVLINMIFLIAHWDRALSEMDNLEELPENTDELFAEAAEGVGHFYQLMREIYASVTQTTTPFTKPAAPNRNDPCPCGSGKKFKKCCLN